MKKQNKSSVIKNHKITKKKIFDGIPLKVALQILGRKFYNYAKKNNPYTLKAFQFPFIKPQ